MTPSVLGSALTAIVERVQELDARFLVPALALQLATLVLRAIAWRNILTCACRRPIPIFTVVCAYATGVALNGFLPARGGEAAKVGLVRARVPGSSLPAIAGSLGVICLLDGAIAASLVGTLWSTGAIPSLPLPALPDGRQLTIVLAAVVACGALLVAVAAPRFSFRLRPILWSALDGLRILRSPWRLGAWACRVIAIFLALQAFHIHAGLATATLVVVLSGASTAVPVPGGGGSQQLFATYALRGSVPAAGAMSFSFGVQLGVTALNTAVGIAAAMVLFRTLRPVTALRAARARPI